MEDSREASPIEVKQQPEQIETRDESPKGFKKNPKLQDR